mmetsp:Transcript_65591/g.200898  ORF Transcript_65591/g.200898 Transcript_65591/m.200898 type:complete len:275 (+) Transcript_65591:110-934(+)
MSSRAAGIADNFCANPDELAHTVQQMMRTSCSPRRKSVRTNVCASNTCHCAKAKQNGSRTARAPGAPRAQAKEVTCVDHRRGTFLVWLPASWPRLIESNTKRLAAARRLCHAAWPVPCGSGARGARITGCDQKWQKSDSDARSDSKDGLLHTSLTCGAGAAPYCCNDSPGASVFESSGHLESSKHLQSKEDEKYGTCLTCVSGWPPDRRLHKDHEMLHAETSPPNERMSPGPNGVTPRDACARIGAKPPKIVMPTFQLIPTAVPRTATGNNSTR